MRQSQRAVDGIYKKNLQKNNENRPRYEGVCMEWFFLVTTQFEHQMASALLLDVVVSQRLYQKLH